MVGSSDSPPPVDVPVPVTDDPLARLRALARDFAASSHAPATRRSYDSAWGAFRRWAVTLALDPLPASGEVVALYLSSLASDGKKTATISRALAAIVHAHREGGFRSPRESAQVRKVFRGIRRRLGSEQTPKAAISSSDLRAMVATCADDVRGGRDRAILTLGFASGLRRSELVALTTDDLRFVEEGVVLRLRTSKTDQEHKGRLIGVRVCEDEDVCAVHALRRWLDLADIIEGPVFRPVSRGGRALSRSTNGRTVERVVKAAAARIGLDPRTVSAHSLRHSCATTMALAGEDAFAIQRRLGHAAPSTSSRYVRAVDVF